MDIIIQKSDLQCLIAMYIKYSQIIYHSEKNNGNKNNKNNFNKNEGRCRDGKTQKACEQWDPKLNKPLPYNPTYM